MKTTKDLIQDHLNKLCREIGARPTGSEPNKAAVQYAMEEFEKMGCNVMLQDFPCMSWANDGARLEVDGMLIEAIAAEYSLPCDVSGDVVCVNTIDQLQDAKLKGKICVMNGELCKEPLMPKSFTFWNPKEHQEIIRLLEEKEPLAVITVSFLPDVAVPIIQDGDFTIPCTTVKGNYLDLLLSAKAATLQLFTERKSSTGANVIATYGNGPQKISFSAHIDTKPETPGALDNASGVAALLALADKVVKQKYSHQVEFVLFNGEDYYSTPGEVAYMSTYLQNPNEYICAFNVDGLGMQESKTSFSFYECPDKIEKQITALSQNYSGVEKIDPWPMGDHMLFASSSVPAVAITASNIFTLMESVMHTPGDNLSILDIDKIVEAVLFLYSCIEKVL